MVKMVLQYRTKDDDILDALCFKIYGTTTGTVETVLNVNPHLADCGAILPEGLLIHFPPRSTSPTINPTIKLWD